MRHFRAIISSVDTLGNHCLYRVRRWVRDSFEGLLILCLIIGIPSLLTVMVAVEVYNKVSHLF